VAIFSPYPTNSPAFPAIRSGGGGGQGGKGPDNPKAEAGGGGGGGGGRGNAGNPGGAGGGGELAQQPIQLHSIAYRSRRVLQHQSQSHLPEGRSSFPGILSSRKTGWQRENSSKFSRLGG
jgi:hypothetical protein